MRASLTLVRLKSRPAFIRLIEKKARPSHAPFTGPLDVIRQEIPQIQRARFDQTATQTISLLSTSGFLFNKGQSCLHFCFLIM